jgi:hypothetical protein
VVFTIELIINQYRVIKMSQETSYWGSLKLWFGSYKDSDYRQGRIEREHYMDEIESHDFVVENSVMSNRFGTRLYKDPSQGIPFPRECAKFVGRYYDCRRDFGVHSIADQAPQECTGKKAEMFDECPHWVLENLAAKRKFYKRAEEIDRLTYMRAMEVSDYNK